MNLTLAQVNPYLAWVNLNLGVVIFQLEVANLNFTHDPLPCQTLTHASTSVS